MLQILKKETKISTIDLLKSINAVRVDNAETSIRANDFNFRVADELDGEHYETFVVENLNKTTSSYFMLTIDQAKQVAMRESKTVRRAVVASLKQLEQSPQFNIPQTLPEALRLAADLADQLAIAAPKVAIYELLADRKGDVNTTIVAKELGTSATKLNDFLRDKGVKWMNGDLPKAGYMEWFNVVALSIGGKERHQCLVTPLGQIKIAELWGTK